MANETCSYECKPHIGADGFWYVGAEFTGVRAAGTDGVTPNIGADGYWYIWDKNMGVKAVGEPGVKGDKGDKGDNGAVGSQGIQGVRGPQGVEGPQGRTGVAGPQGTQGLQGPRGDKGDTGAKGDMGPAGPVNMANNLTTESEGYALDARMGKHLNDIIPKIQTGKVLCRFTNVSTLSNTVNFPERFKGQPHIFLQVEANPMFTGELIGTPSNITQDGFTLNVKNTFGTIEAYVHWFAAE